MEPERIYDPLTLDDLERLKEIGLKEHEEFFKRNPHLRSAFYETLIGIFLCQGAASHFVNPSVGIKDFDIWHFYVEHDSINFPYRAHRRIEHGYKNRPIDFLKRAIPRGIFNSFPNDPEKVVMTYLLEKNTISKNMLLKKAIIGLYPDKIFGKVIWRGEL